MAKKKKGPKYIRLAVFPVSEVLPLVFTREVRKRLRMAGHNYKSEEWKRAASHRFWVNHTESHMVPMGSHRYQLYAEKGTKCVNCPTTGTYFALERGATDYKGKFHFNLYGRDKNGREVMITKDHIIPRSKGGKNKLENYQPMCAVCNRRKADKMPDD
jgi:5-methylcytosine-specific restriction endonuclease McrA